MEVLDWTASALDRVDRGTFFARFREGEAVPYFYEPFLAEFDPELRKQLGVWYTPAEVVRYMVARVDKALRDDLGVPDGLAADNVYVLDPCCGTGAYPAEVLRRIAKTLEGRGLGALIGARVRDAATKRVFGFEIMPAPFVVAHLQMGLTMQDLDAPLSGDGTERAQIFLTNALTGWEPSVTKLLPFPELEEERDRAERVKQETPILVILGNPPYNGFAGMAMDEERELSKAYRTTKRVRKPEGGCPRNSWRFSGGERDRGGSRGPDSRIRIRQRNPNRETTTMRGNYSRGGIGPTRRGCGTCWRRTGGSTCFRWSTSSRWRGARWTGSST